MDVGPTLSVAAHGGVPAGHVSPPVVHPRQGGPHIKTLIPDGKTAISQRNMGRMNFLIINQKIERIRSECISNLRIQKTKEALEDKKSLDELVSLVRWAELHNIQPNSTVICLPNLTIQSPSSAFRIIDDNETESRNLWTDLTQIDNKFFLQTGDIVLKNHKVREIEQRDEIPPMETDH
ncbi:MAG: hypothetical protein IPN71_03820 [Fibrobacteres bacterium]|nr:hypothetical protein [Fibrobacterota bacterium]